MSLLRPGAVLCDVEASAPRRLLREAPARSTNVTIELALCDVALCDVALCDVALCDVALCDVASQRPRVGEQVST
ncbi:MAG: hypothetical protein M0Z46_03490, partial [Actinomycetota bacterium]|nr:hypothetical protein [Actinomycetota bacterium]